jgi:hypothetical protein
MAILSDGRPSLGRGVPPGQLHESVGAGKGGCRSAAWSWAREGALERPLQGINSESYRNPPLPRANPSRKHLQIHGFAEMRRLNSLRGGTGNQFDQNRESIFAKQGINSRQQGTMPLAR